ncbi:MAG: AAA family ATPase [Spirochaetes bacterium]|nr:AAA family ATPase [Spirochaetota bacterium]
MKNPSIIKEISISGFRGFQEKQKLLLHPGVNVFYGINGSGKSSLLRAINIIFSEFLSNLLDINNPIPFINQDINTESKKAEVKVQYLYNKEFDISAVYTNTEPEKFSGVSELKKGFLQYLRGNNDASLPIVVAYPVNRLPSDEIEKGKLYSNKYNFLQFKAYENAFNTMRDFDSLILWLRQREDLENEKKISEAPIINESVVTGMKKEATYIDPQLSIVRNAIKKITGFNEIKIKREPYTRITIKKEDLSLESNQLSEGEKCLLALIGDIAYRMVILNPGMDEPLHGTGIVMIDEIDLHLHPSWQRMIIPRLRETFPNCQFIITTHSPQILSHNEKGKNFLFRNEGNNITIEESDSSYGLDSGRILEERMHVTERPSEIKEEIKQIYTLIDNSEFDQVHQQIKELKNKIGDDSEIVRMNAILNRKEKLGK